MSEFKTCFTPIKEIKPHGNADSLEVAVVYGFDVIVKKDSYKVGDVVFYVPIDSVLPKDLENMIFPEDSKIKLHNSRVRQIRIRGRASQGMLISSEDIQKLLTSRGVNRKGLTFEQEHDYKAMLGIEKYEPPVPEFQKNLSAGRKKNNNNPLLHSYNGLDNLKWFPDRFKETEEVVVQEKLHGTNCRAGMLPTQANTLWKKIKKVFGLLPEFEFCYGSNNVELTNRDDHKGFYGENVYGKTLKRVAAMDKIGPMEVIYGEIIGEGIQKGYNYGHKEHHFVLFDVKIMNRDGTFKWLDPIDVLLYAEDRGFTVVPTLYTGKFNADLVKELTKGDSVYCPQQKIREGVVVKSRFEYNDESCSSGKRALKVISEAYLDKNNTDFH